MINPSLCWLENWAHSHSKKDQFETWYHTSNTQGGVRVIGAPKLKIELHAGGCHVSRERKIPPGKDHVSTGVHKKYIQFCAFFYLV